jgi:hypothetical protein
MGNLIGNNLRRLVVLLLIGLPMMTTAPALATATATAPALATATATADKKCASLEGCYSFDEMDEFIHVAEDLVFDFANQEYSPQLLWVELRYVPEGESGKEACLEQPGVQATYTDNSYEYCASDNTIYIGQTMLWGFYSEIGDVAPIVGLAHEFGHFLQDVAGVPEPTTPKESVHHEDQADCVAGAWFDHADKEGLLELPDDRQDVEQILDRIGSSEDDPNRTHGTIEERKQSFNDGWVGGLAACNTYYPATPLRSKQERDRWRLLFRELRRSAQSTDARGSTASLGMGLEDRLTGRLPYWPPAIVDALVLADPRRWALRSPVRRPPAARSAPWLQ